MFILQTAKLEKAWIVLDVLLEEDEEEEDGLDDVEARRSVASPPLVSLDGRRLTHSVTPTPQNDISCVLTPWSDPISLSFPCSFLPCLSTLLCSHDSVPAVRPSHVL